MAVMVPLKVNLNAKPEEVVWRRTFIPTGQVGEFAETGLSRWVNFDGTPGSFNVGKEFTDAELDVIRKTPFLAARIEASSQVPTPIGYRDSYKNRASRLDARQIYNYATKNPLEFLKSELPAYLGAGDPEAATLLIQEIKKAGEPVENLQKLYENALEKAPQYTETSSEYAARQYVENRGSSDPIGGFLKKYIIPIATTAGAIAGGPVGAAVANSIAQLGETGKVDPAQVAVAAATASLAQPGTSTAVGETIGLTGQAANVAGGALLGAGISTAAGGDPIKGAVAGAIGSVGSTTYATDVGNALGVTGTAAPIVGNAVINSALSGIAAAATGGNVEKSMFTGAISGAATASAKEVAEAILGADNIKSIATTTGLDEAQVANVFTTSIANGVIAEVQGTGEFLETVGTSLAAQGVGAKTANIMKNATEKVLEDNPVIRASVITATGGIATVATNAAIQGEDVGKALENAAPGIILSSVQAGQREADRQDQIKAAEEAKRAAEQEVDAGIGGFETPPEPVQGNFPEEINAINQTALDIASGKVQVAGLPLLGIGISVGAHAALAYLVSQYELLFPGDVQAQQQALEANPIYIEIQKAAPSTVRTEISPETNKPKLTVKPKPDITPEDATQLEDVTIKIQSDPSLIESQRISDDVFELLKQLFQEPPPPPEEPLPPPEPVKLQPGQPAEQPPGVTGAEGVAGAAGGLTGVDLTSRPADRPTVSGQPLREDIFNRILTDELNRLEQELKQAEQTQKQAESNLQRAQEQQQKFSTPDIIAAAGPGLAEVLEQELNLAAQSAQEAREAREAAASQRSEIGALQRGEATFSDEQLLEYLETGQLPLGRGEGEGEPGTRGPGTGGDEEGAGPGTLEEGEETGAGETGTGIGAGERGEGVGGGGEGEGGALTETRLRPSLIFDRATGGRPETTPFASRVTGEALASILGEKQPLFGGDEDEQQAVWNRRSLRLLSRALGL